MNTIPRTTITIILKTKNQKYIILVYQILKCTGTYTKYVLKCKKHKLSFIRQLKAHTQPVSVWLPWRMPRQHVAWSSSHRWARIFSVLESFK